MKIRLIAPGRAAHPGAVALIDDYAGRIDRLVGYQRDVVREARRGRATAGAQARAGESAAILAAVPAGAALVALDSSGRALDSDAMLLWIGGLIDAGTRELCFAIGGPDGLDDSVRRRASTVLSLSAMTLPHELAEVVLLEAMYRAMMRYKGMPYHR